MEECAEKADELKEEEDFLGALEYQILSNHPEYALEIGLTLLKGICM